MISCVRAELSDCKRPTGNQNESGIERDGERGSEREKELEMK